MNSAKNHPWWRGAVIYQIYPRSFLDTNDDGIGDLPGIIERLDHVAALGVDAVWLSPFFVSPMKDYGYDVADHRRVDPLFGRDADADRLIAEAHRRGLKIIFDLVLPHTSDENPWFRESRRSRDNPRSDWYVWVDAKPDGTPPNNWLSIFGGSAWQWEPMRGQYYLHFFLKSQPNLNWHNPQVIDAMMDVVRFWMDKGVDGLRLDAITTLLSDRDLRDNPPVDAGVPSFDVVGTKNNPFAFQDHVFDRDAPGLLDLLARLRREVDRYRDPSSPGSTDRYLMGEIGDVDAAIAGPKYTRGTAQLHSYYSFALTHDELSAESLRRVVSRIEAQLGDGWTTHTLGNHDTPRAISRFGALPHLSGDRDRLARLLMALVLSLRGGACLYQGEELALPEAELTLEQIRDPFGIEFWPEFKGRDGSRTPIPWRAGAPHAGFSRGAPWLPVPREHDALAVDLQERDPGSVLHAYRRFLAWRKQHPALVVGDMRILPTKEPIFSFERGSGEDSVLCVFNISNQPHQVPLEAGWELLTGHGLEADVAGQTLSLPPFGVFFGRKR